MWKSCSLVGPLTPSHVKSMWTKPSKNNNINGPKALDGANLKWINNLIVRTTENPINSAPEIYNKTFYAFFKAHRSANFTYEQ